VFLGVVPLRSVCGGRLCLRLGPRRGSDGTRFRLIGRGMFVLVRVIWCEIGLYRDGQRMCVVGTRIVDL
jgi:hypothetical protein